MKHQDLKKQIFKKRIKTLEHQITIIRASTGMMIPPIKKEARIKNITTTLQAYYAEAGIN